jgi:hypothetical protein
MERFLRCLHDRARGVQWKVVVDAFIRTYTSTVHPQMLPSPTT